MSPPRIHVVGAAIRAGTRCLVAQRSLQMSHSLKWEFPGGKVEHGETPGEALRREIREELALDIAVGEKLGRGVVVADRRIELDVYAATQLGGELVLAEHARCEWFDADALATLDWAEADLPIIPAVQAWLRRAD